METVTTIGLDIAKSVFQVHGIDAEGKVILRRQLKRRYRQHTKSRSVAGGVGGEVWLVKFRPGGYGCRFPQTVSAHCKMTQLTDAVEKGFSGTDFLRGTGAVVRK
jgi:hypothetical protein